MFMKKSVALLVSMILLLCITVGTTLAFLIDTTDPVENLFNPSKVTTTVEEDIEDNVKKNVKIKNTGDTTAFIRAYVVITWQNDKGEVYGAAPVINTDYTIDWGKTNWLDGNDGFYYYKNPVAPGTSTADNLIDSITTQETAPEGYTLHVEIIGSGIQSKPEAAFNAWAAGRGITYGENALSKTSSGS